MAVDREANTSVWKGLQNSQHRADDSQLSIPFLQLRAVSNGGARASAIWQCYLAHVCLLSMLPISRKGAN